MINSASCCRAYKQLKIWPPPCLYFPVGVVYNLESTSSASWLSADHPTCSLEVWRPGDPHPRPAGVGPQVHRARFSSAGFLLYGGLPFPDLLLCRQLFPRLSRLQTKLFGEWKSERTHLRAAGTSCWVNSPRNRASWGVPGASQRPPSDLLPIFLIVFLKNNTKIRCFHLKKREREKE